MEGPCGFIKYKLEVQWAEPVSLTFHSALRKLITEHSTKDYKIDICCFSARHAALRRKSKD
jgi:hypothetical protein